MPSHRFQSNPYPLSYLEDIPYYSRGFSLYTENPVLSRSHAYIIFGTYDPNRCIVHIDTRYEAYLAKIKQNTQKKREGPFVSPFH